MGRDGLASRPNQRIGQFRRGTIRNRVRRAQKVLNRRRSQIRQQCPYAVRALRRAVCRPGMDFGIRQSRNRRL